MSKELDYIKNEIAAKGKKGRVTVVRWEIDPRTGGQEIPTKIQVNAMVALKELQKPINKRSYTWSKIRPIGIEPFKDNSIDVGSLSDPILRAKIKDALRAEIEAEIKGDSIPSLDSPELSETPKKKKKKIELEVSDEPMAEPETPEKPNETDYSGLL